MFGWKEPPVSEEHFRKWSLTRSRGEVRFVLVKGMLAAVAFEVLGFLLISVWYEHKHFDGLWSHVLGNGIFWLIAGFFAGSSEWRSNEKRYSRELSQFSSANYESPEKTLRGLQPGMTDVAKR